MESERTEHLRKIVEAIEALEASDPSPRRVIDFVVEKRKREARTHDKSRLPQVSGPRGGSRRPESEE